jgi:lactoylglutathione lyase
MSDLAVKLSTFAIWTADVDRSAAFYRDALGLTWRRRIGDRMIVAGAGDGATLMLIPRPAGLAGTDLGAGILKIVFTTGDVRELYQRALSCGATSVEEPTPRDGMPYTIGFVRDPDGYLLELIEQTN